MKLPDNIERYDFYNGYFGWDGRGAPWRITRAGKVWTARPAPNHPARDITAPITRGTLTELAAALASRTHSTPVEPF